jgi:hypothetical protein
LLTATVILPILLPETKLQDLAMVIARIAATETVSVETVTNGLHQATI